MTHNDSSFVLPNEPSEERDEILRELVRSAEDLDQKAKTLAKASASHKIAVKHYMAVRELAAEKMEGLDPYGLECLFPKDDDGNSITDSPAYEKVRYLGMSTGKAAYEALIGSETPLPLMELARRLSNGGLAVSMRSINASMLNMKKVVKVEHKGVSGYMLESSLRLLQSEEDDQPC